MSATFHLILVVAAFLMFLAAGVGWFIAPEPWPYGNRLIALGLACWCLSTLVTA